MRNILVKAQNILNKMPGEKEFAKGSETSLSSRGLKSFNCLGLRAATEAESRH
jgi:hypothetical protein